MASKIPKASRKRLLRLISARVDLDYATEAFNSLQATNLDPLRYHLFVSARRRLLSPVHGKRRYRFASSRVPDYPDFSDVAMNARHQRMVDIRNKFLGHSSIHGMQAFLLRREHRTPPR